VIYRRLSMLLAPAAAAAFLLLTPATASAQQADLAAPSHRQLVSANPFLLMYKWFNVEYERVHRESTTWGLSASLLPVDDADYGNLAAFYRYYPQGRALDGFFIGGRSGVHRVSAGGESGAFFGVGFELGYDWLMGAEQQFSVGIGAGATRLFGGSLEGVSLTVPTVRLVNVGWRF
jgi:hypothetical protein